ncbi:sialate O-acetylesterase [Inquilinus sp. KBS0705]|nr:sialate O-acetylesterase [Inquilinus sp. KBS0705]
MKALLFIISAFFIAPAGYAQLSTSKLFADHMVLQRNQGIPVWGKARKGAKVTITLNGKAITTKANAQGDWKATLPAMKEGGPYSMQIATGKETITYTDVMLGEVWLCSGQSNMEFQLKNAYGYKAEQKNADKVAVRQFYVPRKVTLSPQKDISSGEWKLADATTAGDFTAVGYYYAKQLAENLHVTVGIINSSWGGTEAEDWISRDAMAASPEFSAIVPALPQDEAALNKRADGRLKAYAYQHMPIANYTAEELANKTAAFFRNWQQGSVPGSWEWTGKLYSYRGEGFMQRTISLDSTYQSARSVLALGNSNANMAVYVNGKLLGKSESPDFYKASLPAGTWKPGMNSLLIDFLDQKNTSWFDLGLNGTVNDLNVRFADTTIALNDNKWHVMPDLSKPYHFDFLPNNTASALYNGMINPLVPYAIAGVIWYQGESNADRAYQYRTVFPMLITDWRNKWKQQLPFLFVQLSSFGKAQSSNTGSNWAELREAQNMTLKLPNTALAVTTDIGDSTNIHPKNKADVGYRLAGAAFNTVYHVPGFYESPLFASADFTDNYALVNFTNAEQGLMVKDKYGYIRGFEVAGADHKFYYAQAVITDKSKVKVWSSNVPHPVAVRYGWMDAPVEANLFNIQGLPVSAFRSDSWGSLTEGKNFE